MSSPVASSQPCPSDSQLEQFLGARGPRGGPGLGDAGEGPPAAVRGHLENCAVCRERLEGIRNDNELVAALFEAHRGKTIDRSPTQHAEPIRGVSIPGYEVLSEIKRGGQGVVYRAVQQRTKRTVALKVLLHGSFASVRQRQRFEREIDLAAGLQHPNIVTIFDSGTAPDGSLFFAMEYVEGRSLDEFMRTRHGATASDDPQAVNAALGLFTRICAAIDHAHRHGVIHRDLKPSNIRVDESGEPHVLDFGLAKPADPETAAEQSLATLTGEFMGTLAYASPEQTKGDPRQVDVLTDVYSLGVILYEMLTSHLPYRVAGSMADAIRTIVETDPEPPSSWYRSRCRSGSRESAAEAMPYKVNDEIETIVLKALSKEKSRRYQSAGELQRDVERYLSGEPIEAKRDSKWYVFQKQVRRNKGRVSVAGICVLSVIVVFVMLIQRNNALAKANDFKTELFDMIEDGDPVGGTGANPGFLARLDAQSAWLEEEYWLGDDRKATMHLLLGRCYKGYGAYDKAQRELTKAEAILRQGSETPDGSLAATLNNLGDVYHYQERYEAAFESHRESMEIRERRFGGDHPDLAESLNDLAADLEVLGQFEEAEENYRKALAMRQRLLGDAPGGRHYLIGASMHRLAGCLVEQGEYEEAESLSRASLAMHQELGLGEDPKAAWVLRGLARSLRLQGKHAEAGPHLERALTIQRARLGPETDAVAKTMHEQAELLYAEEKLDEAAQLSIETLECWERVWPGGHSSIADSLNQYGRILLAAGLSEDAEAPLREAVAGLSGLLGEDHYRTTRARSDLAACLIELGRFEEAETLLLDSFATLRGVLDVEHVDTQCALQRILALYEAWARPEESAGYLALVSDTAQPCGPSGP